MSKQALHFQLCHSRRQQLNTNGQAHINQRSRSRELLLLNIQSRSAKAVVNTSSVDEMEGYTCAGQVLPRTPPCHVFTLAGLVSHMCDPPPQSPSCKTSRTSSLMSIAAQDGGRRRKRWWGEKKEKGVEDAGENSCTFNYDQEVFHQRMEALQFCCTRKSGPDAVYCVERLLYTIIVHIQLPLQHLICIIGSLMKLALWNKKIQKKKKK